MKILIATPDFPLWDGGISTVSFEVAMGLHRIGHDISVLTPLQNPSDINFDSTLPFKIFRIKNIKDHYLKTYYHIMKMNQLIKKYKFDLIMAQSWYPSGIAAVNVAKRHKVKMTVTVHGNEILNLRFVSNFWLRKMEKVFDEADKIFCVSNYTHQKLKQRLQNISNINKNTAIVYNGVDYNYFSPAKPDEELVKRYNLQGFNVILTVARLVERKGQDMVIRSLSEIKKHIPKIKYIICGRGSYEDKLKDLVKKLNLTDSVVFAGFIPNEQRTKFYNLCDLYVMPSREILEKGDVEGFGITYLEANACKKPVIGSKTGGATEAIVDGETGFLVNPIDSKEIAKTCVMLLSNKELSKKIGENGRMRIIREFNWDNVCRQIEKYISSI